MPARPMLEGEDNLNRFEDEDQPLSRLASRREMHLSDALVVIRKKLWLITIWTFCGLVLALVATWLTQKRYSPTVTIEVHKEGGNSFSLDDLSGISSQLGGGDQMSVDLLTQQMIIGNENVAIKVMEDLSLAKHEPFVSLLEKSGAASSGNPSLEGDPVLRDRAVRLFQSRLRVTLVKGTRLIDVTYTDQDPRQAALVANAVVEAYVIEATQQRYDATSKTSSWLTNQLSDLKAKVSESQKEVSDFRQKAGLFGASPVIDTRHGAGGGSSLPYDNLELERLTDMNRQLTAAEVNRISDEAIYRMTQSQNVDVLLGLESSTLASGIHGESIFSGGSQDMTTLKQLRAQAGQIKLELAANTTKYGVRNPIIVELRSQLSELDVQMTAEMRRVGLQAKNHFELAAATENSIRKTVEAEKQKISKLNNSADQLLLLQQEEASKRTLYQDLYSKLEAANVIAGVKSSNVTIVNPARIPASPSKPQPIQNVGLGILAGLAAGLFSAFASDFRNDAITTPDDLAGQTGHALLGLVPLVSRKSKIKGATSDPGVAGQPDKSLPAAWVLRAPRSSTAEAYRQIRTAIFLSRPSQPPKTILFASSLSGDGKTTTCYNAGFAFALQGSRVLLIDADMRKPSLHAVLQLPNDRGLSQCLSSNLDPETVIHQHRDLENVYVLTSGPLPPTPSELLGSARFGELLETLKSSFDFIFIDAPPTLMVTDSVLIAQQVDGIVLIIRAGITRRAYLRRALELLSSSRHKLLGVILNAADLRSAEYGSAYKYYGDRTYYGDSNE